jgi:hypothetical protein
VSSVWLLNIGDTEMAYPLVVVARTEVSFPDLESFSRKIFATIWASTVARFREELVINVPRMPALEVWMSIFVALTD